MVPVTLILNCLLASAGYLTIGILTAWPATALPSIRDSLDDSLSVESQSWIGSTGHVGAFVGTIFSILISKHICARQGLVTCGGISLIGWILIFLSSWFSFYLIYPGLFLMGWSCGLSCPLSSIYVSELAGGGNKGVVTSIFNFNLTVGILFANVLGVVVKWHYSSLAIALIHALLFIAIFALVPSPNEQAKAGSTEKMVDVLKMLRTTNEEDILKEANMITEALDEMKKKVKKSHIDVVKAMNMAQFKKWGIILMLFSLNHFSGIFVVSAYLVDIFSSTQISSFVLVNVSGLSEIVFSFFQMTIADKLGRKVFLVISGLGTSLTSAAFAAIFWNFENIDGKVWVPQILVPILSSNITLVSCLVVYYLSYNIGLGPVKFTLLSEMFTPAEQETIAGLCHTWHWFLGFIVVKMFHFMFIKLGLVIIFLSISSVCLASAVFTIFFVPETREQNTKPEKI